ncbi:uncharacterized protein LOC135952392 [Calliphora vicina]|uniref:uncharacterized protein LOC135952392 n=1 Tax=Calliphora vicina TaxID=7373 RepID=UPI00325AF422
MKLLYSFLILGLIQLVFIKPLTASTKSETSTLKQKLVEFYDNGLESIDKDFCEKAKVLSEKLLQDKVVKQPKTPIMRKFKQNLTDFLRDYNSYQRYGLTQQLVLIFKDKLPDHSHNKDIEYIWKLLEKQGYYEMDKNYESKYMKFVKNKILTKFEEFKEQLNQQELKQHKDLIKGYNKLKRCQTYKCQSKYLYKLLRYSTPKAELLKYINEKVDSIYIFYGNTADNISKAVLKHKRLSQLPNNLKLNLTKNIKDFNEKYEKHQHIDELYKLLNQFHDNILQKYYYNTTIPLKEQKLIKQIFDAAGYAKFTAELSRKLNDFVQLGLFQKFKQFKAALTRDELAKEKFLIRWYDRLRGHTTTQDIAKMLNELFIYMS